MLRIPPIREDALRLGGSGSDSNNSGGSGSSPQDGQSSQSDLESHPTAMGRKIEERNQVEHVINERRRFS